MPLSMKVGLGPGDFVFDGDRAPSPKRGRSPLSIFRRMSIVAKRLDGSRWHLAWSWAFVNATLCSMGTQLLFPKKGAEPPPPSFLRIFVVATRLDASRCHLVWKVDLRPGDLVLDGDAVPLPPKRAESPIFGPGLCSQTAAWIKMPLGTEVGVSLRDIVLDGDPAPPPLKGHSHPIFVHCPLWPNCWMD